MLSRKFPSKIRRFFDFGEVVSVNYRFSGDAVKRGASCHPFPSLDIGPPGFSSEGCALAGFRYLN